MVLVDIWIILLALAVVLYVVLDGFVLGIGLLFPFTRNEEERDRLMESIAPVWDANQTWIVFGGGGLFVAFPLVYGILFSALYIPLFTLLYGLIFRGVSLEFRAAAGKKEGWNNAFFSGSLVAVVAQGLTLGGILSGTKTAGADFAGGAFDWLNPFSSAAAAGLIAGYILLGSAYLVIKTTGRVQKRAFQQAFWSAHAVLAFQILMIVWTPFHYPQALSNWLSSPRIYFIWIFPVLTLISYFQIIKNIRTKDEHRPFVFGVVFFLAGYFGLFSSLYPYAIPPAVSFYDAAAQPETLRITLWGAVLILPFVLGYTIFSYLVFRGKVGKEGYHH